jgi:hypothetical protein
MMRGEFKKWIDEGEISRGENRKVWMRKDSKGSEENLRAKRRGICGQSTMTSFW